VIKRIEVYDLKFDSLLELFKYIEFHSCSSWKEYLLNELSIEPDTFVPLAPVRFNLNTIKTNTLLTERILKEAYPNINLENLIHEITIPVLNLFMNYRGKTTGEKITFQKYKKRLEQLNKSLEKSYSLIGMIDDLSSLNKRLPNKSVLQTTHMSITALREQLLKELSAIKKVKKSDTLLVSVNALYDVFYRNLNSSNKGKKTVTKVLKWPYELDSSLKNELENKAFEPKIFCLILIDQLLKMLNIDESITVSTLRNLKQKNKKPEQVRLKRAQFENNEPRIKKRARLLRGSLPRHEEDKIINMIFDRIEKEPINIDKKIPALSKHYMEYVVSYLEKKLASQIAQTSSTGNRSALISIGLKIAEIENFKSGFAVKGVKEK
jgi:hypothetical protein